MPTVKISKIKKENAKIEKIIEILRPISELEVKKPDPKAKSNPIANLILG